MLGDSNTTLLVIQWTRRQTIWKLNHLPITQGDQGGSIEGNYKTSWTAENNPTHQNLEGVAIIVRGKFIALNGYVF